VSNQDDKQEIAELSELNQELTAGIKRCRTILNDCRERLAANSNEIGDPDKSEGLSQSG
jgi:hypothetical protein